MPVLTQAHSLSVTDGLAVTQRQAEAGDLSLTAPLPCIVEVTEAINKPCYPTLKGKMAAKTKPVQLVRLADIGVGAVQVGAAGAGTVVVHLGKPASRRDPVVVDDPVRAPERIVTFLEARRLI